jgi:autotransporter family porin
MEKQFSYRIVKIGGKAVAVALTALGLMAGSASAADVYLGTALSQAAPNDGTTATGARWRGDDRWDNEYNPIASYGVSTSRAGDVFYGNTVTYSGTGYTSVIGGVAYNAYPWGNSNPVTGTIGYLDDNWPWVGIDAQRTGTFVANVFGDITDGTAGNNYHFGAGTTVGNYSRGSKAYAYGTYWTYGINSDAAWSIAVYSGMAAGTPTNYAIDINGDASFAGNNTINGDVRLQTAYIDGSNVIFNGDVASVGGLVYRTAGSASLNGGGDLTGSVNFQGHNATLTLSNGSDITGSVVNSATDNGTLNFEGSSVVTGDVGTVNAANVTGATSRVQLNTVSGDTNVNTLTISADKAVVEVGGKLTGNVNLGGHTSKLELNDRGGEGMVGTVDFGKVVNTETQGRGTLEIGNGVDATFGADGIQLANAANSTLLFAGTSNVSGQVGSASDASKTPYKIYAGAGTSTVTFNGRVYVGAGDLNVGPSNTTVELNAGLTGDLVFGAGTPVSVQGDAYTTYGDGGLVGQNWNGAGTVELADNQTITGSITTSVANAGNMKFMGRSAYSSSIGALNAKLASVTFNAATQYIDEAPVVSTIAGNVYANQVTIGNGSAYTTATLTPGAHILGDNLTLAGANTVLNLHGAFNSEFGPNADNNKLSSAGFNQVEVQGGNIITNGATLKFAVDSGDVTAANGAVQESASSLLFTNGGAVNLSGGAQVDVALMGSVAHGQVAKLIKGTANLVPGTSENVTLSHNSFVLREANALTLRQNTSTEDLELVVNRTAAIYKESSATVGHFSNAAADRLGALAAAGADYTSDMQTVFNKLDIDQWGFGNTQANLATQVKRLAPVANASGAQAALASTTSVLNSVGERLAVLRGDVAMAGLNGNGRQMGTDNTGWVKVLGSNSKAEAIGDYDGYKVTSSGLLAGADAKVGNGVVGGSFSYVSSNISQQDFRLGDSGKMNSGTLAVYGTQEYGDVFVDGALAFSQHSLSSSRATAIARTAQSDVDMNQTTLKLSAGYRIGIDDSKVNVLTPMVSVEAASLKQKAYTETGADALSLNVDSKTVSRTRASLGLRFNTVIEGASTTFYPELMVAFNRNQGMRNTDVVANYVGDTTATPFTTTGVVLPKSSYTVGAGLRFATSKTSEVQIGYRYEGGNGLSGSSAQVRGAWSF